MVEAEQERQERREEEQLPWKVRLCWAARRAQQQRQSRMAAPPLRPQLLLAAQPPPPPPLAVVVVLLLLPAWAWAAEAPSEEDPSPSAVPSAVPWSEALPQEVEASTAAAWRSARRPRRHLT